jgi:hypothetical protein
VQATVLDALPDSIKDEIKVKSKEEECRYVSPEDKLASAGFDFARFSALVHANVSLHTAVAAVCQ